MRETELYPRKRASGVLHICAVAVAANFFRVIERHANSAGLYVKAVLFFTVLRVRRRVLGGFSPFIVVLIV